MAKVVFDNEADDGSKEYSPRMPYAVGAPYAMEYFTFAFESDLPAITTASLVDMHVVCREILTNNPVAWFRVTM
jgi:hypothetical protein